MMSFGSAPVPQTTDIRARGRAAPPDDIVHHGLRVAAAYAWRLIVLGVAVYLVFVVLAKLTLVAVAVFVGLVITALLRPLVDLFSRALPRGLALIHISEPTRRTPISYAVFCL